MSPLPLQQANRRAAFASRGEETTMKITRTFAAGAVSLAALIAGGAAFADCGIQGAGSVRILSNDFEALRIVNDVPPPAPPLT